MRNIISITIKYSSKVIITLIFQPEPYRTHNRRNKKIIQFKNKIYFSKSLIMWTASALSRTRTYICVAGIYDAYEFIKILIYKNSRDD